MEKKRKRKEEVWAKKAERDTATGIITQDRPARVHCSLPHDPRES